MAAKAKTNKPRLASSIASPQDLQAVILELREYANWSQHVAVRQKALKHKGHAHTSSADHADAQPVLSPAAKVLIHDHADRAPLGQDSLDDLISEVELLAAAAPHINITLAAPAHGSLKKELVAWCRENIAPDILVSFSFNRTLLGGMVIRSGSRIFDWSFRRSIMNNRDKFPRVFHEIAGPLKLDGPEKAEALIAAGPAQEKPE